MLSNCFMETFSQWMERPCKEGLTGEDRAPCCQASRDHCFLLNIHFSFEPFNLFECSSNAALWYYLSEKMIPP